MGELTRVTKGFTLLELLIGVALVAILSAIAIPSFFMFMRDAQISEGVKLLGYVSKAQEEFKLIKGGGERYSQCFRGQDPAFCTSVEQSHVSSIELNFSPPPNSKFNLLLGPSIPLTGQNFTSSAFFLSSEQRAAIGLSTQSSLKGNEFGYDPQGEGFMLGAEALIYDEYELLGMENGLILQICSRGDFGPNALRWEGSFGKPPNCGLGSSGGSAAEFE